MEQSGEADLTCTFPTRREPFSQPLPTAQTAFIRPTRVIRVRLIGVNQSLTAVVITRMRER